MADTIESLKAENKRAAPTDLRPVKCVDCGVNYADPPSKFCPGCEAYREHQS